MMGAHDSNCTFTGLPATGCDRIDYFSNTDNTWDGQTMGITNSRDMATFLDSAMDYVSSWRDSGPPGAPQVLATPWVTQNNCYDRARIHWPSNENADAYRLYESASSSFTSPYVVYTGGGTNSLVSIPSNSTLYYRVRACNSFGCSNYSPQVSASWQNYC